jgi:hypothetical protein
MALLGLTALAHVRNLYLQYFEMFLMNLSHLKNKVPGQNCCGLLVVMYRSARNDRF